MNPFIYCLNTSTIRPVPLLEKIRIAGLAGYAAIEPWNDEITEYLVQGGATAELKHAIKDAGLRVVSVIALHGWITGDGRAHAQALEECKRRMAQAAELESPHVVASPPREKIDLARAGERFAELLALGETFGAIPSMEFLGFVDGVNNLADALTIARSTGDPRATVVADVFHMIRGGGSVDDLLRLKSGELACFHINDVPAIPDPRTQSDSDRVMVGDGTADLNRVVANLRAIDYHGPISLELFNRELWAKDPLEVAKVGLERIRALTEDVVA